MKIKGLCEVPEGEEDEMDDNGESITDVSVLGSQMMQDKSQRQKLLNRFKKVPAHIKRKLPQDVNNTRKYFIKETKSVEQGVQLIQTSTINPNDILDTNNAQVCSSLYRLAEFI